MTRPTPDAIRDALIQAALNAYEEAGVRGLCAEGRWEVAVDAMRTLDVDALASSGGESAHLREHVLKGWGGGERDPMDSDRGDGRP